MEAFQLLSRGGVSFNKKKFREDVSLFSQSTMKSSSSAQTASERLPSELDFFQYSTAKRDSPDDTGPRKRARFNGYSGEGPRNLDDSEADDGGAKVESSQGMVKQRVTTKGRDIPPPAESFHDMKIRYKLPQQLLSNLSKFDFQKPTGIQAHACPILMESRDVAAISPTGTGKTLSYLLPIFAALNAPSASATEASRGVRAVVLVPTRELAHQIHNECLKLAEGRKWRIVLFNKSTAATLANKSVQEKVDIIISTPLRLVAALRSGNIDLNNVRHLILDEADRMLDTEFLDQVQEIIAACTHESIQKGVFSATLPANAEKVAMSILRNPVRIVVGLKDTPLPLIAQSLTYVSDDASKLPTLLQYLSQPYNAPIIIFTATQPRATSLAEELVLHEVPNVDCLHAGMTNKEREESVRRMQRGESWILVSTEVMARGMDFKGVREVINYDFPRSVQSYVHRIGRTGRAGREGKAVTYFTDEDAPFLKAIANVILQSGSTIPEWMLKLPKPSKMKRKQMGKQKRADAVNPARSIGRGEAIKRRDMIAGSKRREERRAADSGAEG